jgi:YD repeat-containing protein
MYNCCRYFHGEVDCDFDSERTTYIGPFIHYPGSLGYQQYTVTPGLNQLFSTFTVKTFWKAYPDTVESKVNGSSWKTVATTLKNKTVKTAVSELVHGENTLYFSENSSYNTKFSWELYVPVDNTPDTYTTSMQYDDYGNVLSVTDAESNTVTFTYSSDYGHAYLTEVSATVGQDTITTKATYDYHRGWILSVQEPKGVAGSGYDYLYTYDVLGRIIKKEFPLLPGQSERSYIQAVYDCENRIVTLIDQLRHYTVKEFDKLGRLTAVKTYTGQYGPGTLYATKSYTYQYDDLVSMVTDPGNHTTIYTYDFLGRTTQIQFSDASTVSYTYDDTNNSMIFTNGRGYDRICLFDWLNQLTKVEEEYSTDLFAITTYYYDEIGHLTSFIDAENRTTSYDYASLFGLTRITYPDSTYKEYVYDNTGNITLVTDANQNETHLFYDALYRLTQIQYQDQSTVFMYDLNSNRIRMDDNAPNTGDYAEYTYDSWNRLITETRHSGQDIYTVSYQYDTVDRLIQLMYPDTMQILYSYDDLNRTTGIKRYIDGVNDEVLLNYVQYDTESLLTQFNYGNNLQAAFSYDSRHRPLTISVKDGDTFYLDLDYIWDYNSNITQLVNGWRDTSSDWHSDTELYSYDGLDRLTSANCASWSHSYSYDKVGNRTTKDGITYTVNLVNQVTALSDGTSFTYDLNGNRIQKTKGSDTWVYTCDDANRLTKVEKNSTTIGEYIYDGDGKRIHVTEPNKTTTYIYTLD